MMPRLMVVFWMLLLIWPVNAVEPFGVQILDKTTKRPVPLVELKTTSEVTFVTDNAGWVAIDSPELLGREVWFHVRGHGYSVAKDGFGYRGLRLTTTPGRRATIEINRDILAERVGRWTGSGLFAESQKLGLETDWKETGIVGQDTVQTVVFRNQRFWLWGDTVLPDYPLGLFQVSGARTKTLPDFHAPLRPTFNYFRDQKQRPRNIAVMPGDGPTWVFGLTAVKNVDGDEKLVGVFTKVRNHLESYEWSLCVWNEQTENFEKLRTLWTKSNQSPTPPPLPNGHAIPWSDENGKAWLLFGDPFPRLKMPATFEAWQDPKTWQTLDPPTKLGNVLVHGGSIGYHRALKKWVAIFTQKEGEHSFLGDVWFAESMSPFGPWSKPVRVLHHDNYTFYNPKVHVDLLPPDSTDLLFEGTYTAEFARNATPTLRHNYNQILYRLDLREPRLRSK
jgi:hypothetical protein